MPSLKRLSRWLPSVHLPPAQAGSPASHQSTIAAIVGGVGSLLLLALVLLHTIQGQEGLNLMTVLAAIFAPQDTAAHQILWSLRLPRVGMGILAGMALGMAGVLFQTITRNPLASPDILGVNSGAYFAIVLTTLFAPGLMERSPLLVALTGGLLAAGLVYAIAASVKITPTRLALAGLAVSLTLAAFTAALQLFYENETAGLFFWGAGSLVQTDWRGNLYALPRLASAGLVALLLSQPLDVLLLGEDMARSLGQRIQLIRLVGMVVGVFLAAVVTSVVGAIGFVGLLSPHLVRLMGIRVHQFLLPTAAIWGAVLLVGADSLAQSVTTNVSELPTGSMTALIGAPFLIWLVRQPAVWSVNSGRDSTRMVSATGKPVKVADWKLMGGAIVVLLGVLFLGLMLGDVSLSAAELVNTIAGSGTPLSRRILLHLRLPRVLTAAIAGASLAVSGLLLQGVVRNPLAGPEFLGITSGASLGALTILVLFPEAPVEMIPVAAIAGAFVTFGLVCAVTWRDGLAPMQLVLVGLAATAFCAAATNLLIVQAKLRAAQAVIWLAGSTYALTWSELGRLILCPLVLLPLAWWFARWLDLLALGDDLPRMLGIKLQRARGVLLAIAVALAGATVATVGAISFVGLIAPQAARVLVGSHHRRLVLWSALLGAILVVAADTLGRVAIAPREIPSGLVTAMIGTPYFLYLLWSSRRRVV
ncbi:MAG: iron ABC transporter permease [Stenomitos frigidus ULC029]